MNLLFSKNSFEELSSMSSYYEPILMHHFDICKIRKNAKISIFQNEFLGGSFYLNGLKCSEIESLGVLEVFCIVF